MKIELFKNQKKHQLFGKFSSNFAKKNQKKIKKKIKKKTLFTKFAK